VCERHSSERVDLDEELGRKCHILAIIAAYAVQGSPPVPRPPDSFERLSMKALKKFHVAAADHYEKAAEHHRSAADHADEGNPQAAAHHAHIAQGHALHGHEHAAEAAKKHIELHAEHGDEDDDK
jgi:hypothetical protein